MTTERAKIRFVIDNINSKRDIYGNCYWSAQITSTITNKSIWLLNHGGDRNAEIQVHTLTGYDYPAVKTINRELPIRKYFAVYRRQEQLRKKHGAETGYYYEHELTAEILNALEDCND